MIRRSPATVMTLAPLALWTFAASAATVTLDIEAHIDGRDQLIIRDDSLQWEHFDFGAVGRSGNMSLPTIISASLDGVPVLDRFEWFPQWSLPAPSQIRQPETSSAFTGLPSVAGLGRVSLETVQARWETSVIRSPKSANSYTTIVEFDDNPPGGADWYHARLTFETGSPQPLPLQWQFQGTITEIGDPDAIFTDVQLGDVVRGLLRYVPSTPPTNADENTALYEHNPSFEVAKVNIVKQIDGRDLSFTPDQMQFADIQVFNDLPDPDLGPYDGISAFQSHTPPQGFGGAAPMLTFVLAGPADVLEDTTLPTTLDLSDWSDAGIAFTDLNEILSGESTRYIYARIDSLTPVILLGPGDYDADGDVDGADCLAWQRTLGSQDELAADGDGSGLIDAPDLNIWRNHFGPAGSTGSANSVPEPGGVLLLCMALLAAFKRPRGILVRA